MRYLLLTLPLAACAVSFPVGPVNPQGEGLADATQGTLIIYRNAEVGFVGNVATTPELAVDGRPAGICLTNKPVSVVVEPGLHQVSAAANGAVVTEVEVSAGDTVYLRCGTRRDPALKPAPVLTRVDAETGASEAGL